MFSVYIIIIHMQWRNKSLEVRIKLLKWIGKRVGAFGVHRKGEA
jgi:hypothetical protein